MANGTLNDLEQLAFLVSIRNKFSEKEDPPTKELQEQINMVAIMKNFCEMILNKNLVTTDDTGERFVRFMTLEICWIMANMSASTESVELI